MRLARISTWVLMGFVATATGQVANVDTGPIVRPKTTLRTHDEVASLAFSPDSKSIAAAADKQLQIWDAAGNGAASKLSTPVNPPNPIGHSQPLTTVQWTPDGKHVASAADDGKVKLWDPATGGKVAEYDAGAGIATVPKMSGLAFSPDGRQLAVGVDGVLTILDAATLRKIAEVAPPQTNERLTPVRFTADGKEIVSASTLGMVRFHDAATRRETRHWPAPSECVAVTADGSVIVSWSSKTGFNAKVVELRDGASGRLTTTFPVKDDVTSIQISANGRIAAVAVVDHTVRLFDVATAHIKATLPATDGPYSAAFSPDGTLLVSGETSVAVLYPVPP
jgi:WD40 repeat protein